MLDEELTPIVKTVFEMFVAGSNYAELIRYLNGRGVKTTKVGEFNKNSFQRILSNRRYLGKYIYQGNEIDGGMPRIIDDELFEQAQQKLALYAAAPARGKAKVEYILSEKLICGKCGNKMTGVSAMSKNKTLHNYYKCVGVTKHTCDKRTIRKQYLEDEVITAITGDGTERNKYGVLTDEFIDMVAAETYTLKMICLLVLSYHHNQLRLCNLYVHIILLPSLAITYHLKELYWIFLLLCFGQ